MTRYIFDSISFDVLRASVGDFSEPMNYDVYYLSDDICITCLGNDYTISSGLDVKDISCCVAKTLTPLSKLTINGTKYKFNDIQIYLLESPMKIMIIEGDDSDINDLLQQNDLSKKKYNSCPLSHMSYFKRKIGICGGPSSGKTETAKQLSRALNVDYKANSFHVTEYATTFIQKYNTTPTSSHALFLYDGQKSREDSACKADIVISDCPTFLCYVYMVFLNAKEPMPKNEEMMLSRVYKRTLEHLNSYTDLVFLRLSRYSENNIRYQTEDEARQIDGRIELFLKEHNVKYLSSSYSDNLMDKLFYINHIEEYDA